MITHARIPLVLFAVGLASAIAACKSTTENPNHCVNQTGDAWCAEQYGSERPFCILDACVEGAAPERGCVDTRPSDACWSPCGGSSFADDPTCEGVADTSTTMTTTTGPSSTTTEDPTMGPGPSTESSDPTTDDPTTTTGPTGCDGPEDCDGATPFCENEQCVDCSQTAAPDAECAGLGGGTPICEGTACVACTESVIGSCEGTTPICDVETNTCVGCSFHEQCQAMDLPACHIAEGSCISAFTDVDATTDGTIQPAIDEVAADTPHAIVLTGGGGDHTITIGGSKIIALVSNDETVRDIQGNAGAPTLTVSGAGAIAYLHRVRLVGNTGDWGVSAASGATLYADNAQIVQNSGGGIELASNTEAVLRNCTVGTNGSQFENTTGIRMTNSSLELLYTSVVANDGDGADSLECDGTSTASVRNSILVGADADSVACAGMDASFSAFDQAVAGNDDINMLNPSWFVGLGSGDLHLTGSGDTTFADIASWEDGDPPFDIDGTDPRPTEDGTPDYAGADVP